MDFNYTPKVQELRARLLKFMDENVYPNEARFFREIAENRAKGNAWVPTKLVEELKPKARAAGLWNLFLPRLRRARRKACPTSNTRRCREIMGRVPFAAEVFNCSAPDTGNMETIARYGSEANKDQWLDPLLKGEIRSAFLMTEPEVASSDATNIQCRIERDGDDYVLNGLKWWSSGRGRPALRGLHRHGQDQSRCRPPRAAIDDPGARQRTRHHRDPPAVGVRLRRRAARPHGSAPDQCACAGRQPAAGRRPRFEIAQGRLGPGRIHHCMRSIGIAERALELMCKRLNSRVAFGKPIASQSVWHERIAEARCMIEQARLLTLKAAYMMDTVGNKVAKAEIAMIKVVAPNMACQIIDWAIQAHGGGGVSDDFPLAYAYASQRTLRLADGPDEVHRASLAKLELAKHLLMPGEVEMPITRGG